MKSLITFCYLILPISLFSQETVPASGGIASGAEGTIHYTIGQIVYSSFNTTNGSVAQGIQQPYEIFTPVGIETSDIQLDIVAYPNPTSHAVNISIDNVVNKQLTYQFIDIQGKILESNQILFNQTTIGLKNLPANTYILNLFDKNELIQSFKIIKN